MESATRRWLTAAATSCNPLEAVMEFYLSPGHLGEKADGCPLAALGSDAARQSEEVRRPFEDGIRAHFEILDELMDDAKSSSSSPSGKAMAILSLMVGAVTLSRILEDENLSQSILGAAAVQVRRIASGEGVP